MAVTQNLVTMASSTNVNNAQTLFNQNVAINLGLLNTYGNNSNDVSSAIETKEVELNQRYLPALMELRGFLWNPNEAKNSIKTISENNDYTDWTAYGTTTVADNTTTGEFMQGVASAKLTSSATGFGEPIADYDIALDLTEFEDGTESFEADTIELPVYINNVSYLSALYVRFYTNLSGRNDNYAQISISSGQLTNGWNLVQVTKNSFTYTNFSASDWANIVGYRVYATSTNTSLQLSVDYMNLKPNVLSQFHIIDKSLSTNSDTTTANLFEAEDTERFKDMVIGSPYQDYFVIKNNTTGGNGAGYPIGQKTDNSFSFTDTLPVIASNVDWEVQRPFWVEKIPSTTFILEDSLSSFKLSSVDVKTASDKVLLCNVFKPTNNSQEFYLKAHFQFRANSSKQGFVFNYLDSDNFLKIYITKNGSSSTVKFDKRIAGTVTNLFTSSTFTISSNDEMILLVKKVGNQFSIYKSNVNSSELTLLTKVNFYDSDLIQYNYNLGLYSDLELRVLEFKASEQEYNHLDTSIVLSDSFSTSDTLQITNSRIHKCSLITAPKLKSLQEDFIFQSDQDNNLVEFTSNSGTETASIEIEVKN